MTSCQRITTRVQGCSTATELPQNWLSGHTSQELQQPQREDVDLKIVHLWCDAGGIPKRDQVDQYSPAVWSYYLNWETLKMENGVIYSKWYPDVEEQPVQIQLLVPKVLRQKVLEQCHNGTWLLRKLWEN